MADEVAPRIIRPQPGPQEMFLSSPADIAIYGGAAGGGKSFALLMEPLRHVHNPGFGGTIFRRTSPQITNEGALWDESIGLYGSIATPKIGDLSWRFPSGASMSFAHLQYDETVLNYQGSQIPFIGFDEVTHFTAAQFWYMVSRNRSICGVRPYIRATCNPDPDSFVAELIAWWINQETGYPIPERSGVIRWFVRDGDTIVWADRPEDLSGYKNPVDGSPIPPKSLTFIAAKLSDNKALLSVDPGYVANLMALGTVERERLLGGNWKIKSGGKMFRREWFTKFIDAVPASPDKVRAWDFASSEPVKPGEDPDWTVGLRMSRIGTTYYVEHVDRFREEWGVVEGRVRSHAETDGQNVRIKLPQDPGSAGKAIATIQVGNLAGWVVEVERPTGAKETRAKAAATQAEFGNIVLVRGDWNAAFIDELCAFPGKGHDDQVDAFADAFNCLAIPVEGAGHLDHYRKQLEALAAQQQQGN